MAFHANGKVALMKGDVVQAQVGSVARVICIRLMLLTYCACDSAQFDGLDIVRLIELNCPTASTASSSTAIGRKKGNTSLVIHLQSPVSVGMSSRIAYH